MAPETAMLHRSLIRLLKGVLSAWETWLERRLSGGEPRIELPIEKGGDRP